MRGSRSAHIYDSTSFHVESYSARIDAHAVAECCESWRKQLQIKWLGAESRDAWRPRCHVVVHARRETYRAAVGRGGEQSFGSSWIDSQNGHISIRRIDLLLDPQGKVSALGHELTHVVIADAFPGGRPPAWANEGLAVLADSAEKQSLHSRDLAQSLRQQAGFHCAELMQLADYPAPNRIATFYGQSAALAEFLADLGGTEKLVPFLKQASRDGYDLALNQTYGIQGIADLQRRWQKHQSSRASRPQIAIASPPSTNINSSP